MAPGAGGKRKRGDRNYSFDGGHGNQRASPHRPGNLSLAQQSNPQQQTFPRDQHDQRGGGRRRGSRGGRGGGSQRSPINSPNAMSTQPRYFNRPQDVPPAIQAHSPAVQQQPSTVLDTVATQTTEQQPPEPLIYFYDYITDSRRENWAESGRVEVVTIGQEACQNKSRTTLSLVFQDLLRAGIDERIDPKDAGLVVKDILANVPDEDITDHIPRRFRPDKIFLDNLSICAEAWNVSTSLKPIVFATGIPAQLMRLILDSSLLESLGLIRSTFVRVGIRQQTNLLYRQSNYNLLREETEGYSKLVTELFTTSSGESLSSEVVEETFERVKGMIGAFDLDVGRVLDVTLDVFAAVLVKQYRFFVKYLRVSSWWPQEKSFESGAAYGLGTLPNWALPGAAGRPMSEDEKNAMAIARDERDERFWSRAKEIGMKAFFEIGNRRIASAALQQALATAATLKTPDASEDQTWMDMTGTLPPVGNKIAAQILGFKLRFYSSSARDASDILPVNIIYLAALLIKIGFISLHDLYPHLWPSEDAMVDIKEVKMKENAEKERLSRPGANMPNALLSAGALTDDSIDPRRARELAKKRELEAAKLATVKAEAEAASGTAIVAVEEKDELPEPAEQKVQLLKSLLCIGALPESLYMLGRFPWLPDAFTELPEHLHRILHHCLSKVYESLRPLKDHNELREQSRILDIEQPALAKGQLRFVDAPPRKIMRWAQLDKDDTNEGIDYKFYWDDWADSIPVCQTIDDVFLLCSTLLNFSGVKLGQDSSLLVKLCRIGRHSMDIDRSGNNRERWTELSKRILLPALSLTKSNAGVANEVFELIKGFSLHTRYSMYAEWFQGQTSRLPDIKTALDRARLETKDVLKRISKSNLKSMARALAKIAYSSPGAVFQLAISQIEFYENFAETFTECARYLTYLAYDVFNWSLLSAVGGGGKSRVQADGMLTSHWLQSLTVFISKVYKRYSVMSPVPMLQYVLDQLTRGNSVDLIVLEEMITTMAGIVSDTNFTDNQVDAMAGGDLLQAQTMLQLLDRRHESRTTAKRLMRCLAEPKLAGQLLVAIAQERENCVYKLPDKDAPAKLLGNLLDEVHRVLTQYLEFMRTNLSVSEFNLLVPDVSSLIIDFGIEPAVAFWICRASVCAAIAEYDARHPTSASGVKQSPVKELSEAETHKIDTQHREQTQDSQNQDQSLNKANSNEGTTLGVDLGKTDSENLEIDMKDVDQADIVQPTSTTISDSSQAQQPWHPVLREIMERLGSASPSSRWENPGVSFYVTFWQLSLRDMLVPTRGYEDEQSRLRNKITAIGSDRSDISIAGTQRKEREKKAIQDLIDRLMSEHKEHITAYSRTRSRLQKEKTSWFAAVGIRGDDLNAALIEHCFFPRIRISSVDALYAFKMFKYLHSSGTTHFRTLRFLDHLFKERQLENMIFLCSAKEAEHMGRFLREVLRDLGRWHADKALFEKEAFGTKKDLKGFCMKIGTDKINEVLMEYEDFRRILNKWHRNLTTALKTCFSSGEYMHIRNAINVSKATVEVFPVVDWMGKQQAESIERVMKSEVKRADLNLAAASLLGNLRRREKEWVMPQAFNLSRNEHTLNGANITRSSSTKPSTPQPDGDGARTLNPRAAAFEPNARINSNGLSRPSISGDGNAEDGEIEDARMTNIDSTISGASITVKGLGNVNEAKAPLAAAADIKEGPIEPQPQEDLRTSSNVPPRPELIEQDSLQEKQVLPTDSITSKPSDSQATIPARPELGRTTSSPSTNGRLQHSLPDRPDLSTLRPGQYRAPEHGGHRPLRDTGREQRFLNGPNDDHRKRLPDREGAGQQPRANDYPYDSVKTYDRDRMDPSLLHKRPRQDHGDRLDMPPRPDARPPGDLQQNMRDKQVTGQTPSNDPNPSAMLPPRSNIPQHPDRAALIHGNRNFERPTQPSQYPERHSELTRQDGHSISERTSHGASSARPEDSRPLRGESRRELRQDERPGTVDRRIFSDTSHTHSLRSDDGHPPAGPRTERSSNLNHSGPNDRFRDSMKPPPSVRSAVDPNHGRLNQDLNYHGQRADQYGRLNSGSDVPSGPRMANGNPPPNRSGRNASAPQPQIDTRSSQSIPRNMPPQSPTMDRQAPTAPSLNRGPPRQASHNRQDANSTSAPSTPVVESPDTAGIHPDRLKAFQDVQNPNNIQIQGGRPPPQPPPMTVTVPRGPSGQQTPSSPAGPSPTNRGPPTGPGRSDKRFAAIQGVLQQANAPNGSDRGGQGASIRGRGGRPNTTNTHVSSNSGPPTPSNQRQDQFHQRQDLFAGRISGPSTPQQHPLQDETSYHRGARRGGPRDGERGDVQERFREGILNDGRDSGREAITRDRETDRRSTRHRGSRSQERDHDLPPSSSQRDDYNYDTRHPPRRDDSMKDVRARGGQAQPPTSSVPNDLMNHREFPRRGPPRSEAEFPARDRRSGPPPLDYRDQADWVRGERDRRDGGGGGNGRKRGRPGDEGPAVGGSAEKRSRRGP